MINFTHSITFDVNSQYEGFDILSKYTITTNSCYLLVTHTIPVLYKKGVNTSPFITSPAELQPPMETEGVSVYRKKQKR
jgi:hypothetical protein